MPSAIETEEIPEALMRLRKGVTAGKSAEAKPEKLDENAEGIASLKSRSMPLIELLEALEKEQVPVMWH